MGPELAKLMFGITGEINLVPAFYFRGTMLGVVECRLLLVIYAEFKNDRETIFKISQSAVNTVFQFSTVRQISVTLERAGDMRGEALLKLGFLEIQKKDEFLSEKTFVCLREGFKYRNK